MRPSLARILSKYCDHIFDESDAQGNVYYFSLFYRLSLQQGMCCFD